MTSVEVQRLCQKILNEQGFLIVPFKCCPPPVGSVYDMPLEVIAKAPLLPGPFAVIGVASIEEFLVQATQFWPHQFWPDKPFDERAERAFRLFASTAAGFRKFTAE
jgi:hypothetical protein